MTGERETDITRRRIPDARSGKGMGVIDRRLGWEERRVRRIKAGLEKAVRVVRVTDRYREIRDLPALSGTDRASDVRYDELGYIYSTRWSTKKIFEVDGGKKTIKLPKNYEYQVLNPRGKNQNYLSNLPQYRDAVYELIFMKVEGSIEKAIRQQQHILDRYAPGAAAEEIAEARAVVAYTENILYRFLLRKRVSKDDLSRLASETGNFLEELGWYDPRDPKKRKALDKLLTVSSLDSRGRPNYLALMARAGAAHTAAVERVEVGGLIVEKFDRNLQVLVLHRENARWLFRASDKQLEFFILGHTNFQRPELEATDFQKESLIDVLNAFSSEYFSGQKVKPYLPLARWAAINLTGVEEGREELDREILGEELATDVFARVPIATLVEEGRFAEARDRVVEVRRMIKGTLKKYESIEDAP